MAHLLKQWLGPTIEHELKEVVEWKQRASRRESDTSSSKDKPVESKTVRDFTDRDFSDLFKDDGSSLSIRWTAERNKAHAVQILEVRTACSIREDSAKPAFRSSATVRPSNADSRTDTLP
jgi:hypothetical protein